MGVLNVDEVRQSYGRALRGGAFLDDFYKEFLASSPEIKPMFAKTDFTKQKELLREGVSFLLMFCQDMPLAKVKIERLGTSHNRSHLNIRPDMYRFWIDSLMKTLKKHDPQFSEALDVQWRQVLNKGIEAMKSAY